MSDTARPLSTLLSNFADNTSGSITAQMLRDAMVSILGEFGMIYRNAGDSVSLTTTPSKLATFDTTGSLGGNVTSGTTKLTVGTTGTYRVTFSAALYSASTGANVNAYIYKNGALITGLPNTTVFVPTSANAVQAVTDLLLDLTAGDYVEVYLATGGSYTVSVYKPTLIVERIK